jgi:hypothetical protein
MKIKYFCFDLRLFVCLGYGLGSAPTPNTLSLIHLVMVMVMFNGKLLVFCASVLALSLDRVVRGKMGLRSCCGAL